MVEVLLQRCDAALLNAKTKVRADLSLFGTATGFCPSFFWLIHIISTCTKQDASFDATCVVVVNTLIPAGAPSSQIPSMQQTGGSTLPGLPPLAAQPSRLVRPLEIVEISACG